MKSKRGISLRHFNRGTLLSRHGVYTGGYCQLPLEMAKHPQSILGSQKTKLPICAVRSQSLQEFGRRDQPPKRARLQSETNPKLQGPGCKQAGRQNLRAPGSGHRDS